MTASSKDLHSPVVISVTSGKGGVGKTNLTVNLAFALAGRNHRVLVVDGDLGLANVDVLLKIGVKATLRDVMENGDDPLSAIIYVEPNLGVLPSSSGVPKMLMLGAKQQAYLDKVLRSIAQDFDFVLVDTAAGIGPSVMWLNTFARHNIVVVSPDPTSMTDAYALIKVLAREYEREEFHLLINMAQDDREAQEIFTTLTNVAVRFLALRPKYLGAIPQDPEVSRAIREQIPFIKRTPQSKASKAVFMVADRIIQMMGGEE